MDLHERRARLLGAAMHPARAGPEGDVSKRHTHRRRPFRGRSGSGFEPVGSILGRVLADLAARGDAERAGRR